MTPEPSARRGPPPLDADELAEFWRGGPTGALCTVGDDGTLVAAPARVLAARDAEVQLRVPGSDPALAGRRACLVADRFDDYESIRGASASGSVTRVDDGQIYLAVAQVSSFSFIRAQAPDAADGATEV